MHEEKHRRNLPSLQKERFSALILLGDLIPQAESSTPSRAEVGIQIKVFFLYFVYYILGFSFIFFFFGLKLPEQFFSIRRTSPLPMTELQI
jgi:hypothetical protein